MLCGRETPIWAKAKTTRPEQSNPLGEAPPHTYGVPEVCERDPDHAAVRVGRRGCDLTAARDGRGRRRLFLGGLLLRGQAPLGLGGKPCLAPTLLGFELLDLAPDRVVELLALGELRLDLLACALARRDDRLLLRPRPTQSFFATAR